MNEATLNTINYVDICSIPSKFHIWMHDRIKSIYAQVQWSTPCSCAWKAIHNITFWRTLIWFNMFKFEFFIKSETKFLMQFLSPRNALRRVYVFVYGKPFITKLIEGPSFGSTCQKTKFLMQFLSPRNALRRGYSNAAVVPSVSVSVCP